MSRRRLARRCEALGCELDVDPSCERVIVDAPPGHVVADTGTHAVVAWWEHGTRAEAYAEALELLAGGVTACEAEACEACADLAVTSTPTPT